MFNQLKEDRNLADLNKYYPNGTEFGIKQPYMKLSLMGIYTLRNDNPNNLIFKRGGQK